MARLRPARVGENCRQNRGRSRSCNRCGHPDIKSRPQACHIPHPRQSTNLGETDDGPGESIPDLDVLPNLRDLENIPYLVAIFYEALRNFHGVSHRLQRVFSDRSIQYKDWVIPPGTPLGMASVHVRNNPEIFNDSYAFKPQRWLPLQTEGQRLQKYILAIGKGSRQCVGKELGKAEILTTLANVFRRFGRDMRLYNTTREKDIDVMYDVFDPLPSRGSNWFMVLFGKKAAP